MSEVMYSYLLNGIRRMASSHLPDECDADSGILGLPNWYRGLRCDDHGGVVFSELNDVWVIVGNLVDILLRLSATAAALVIIVGGIRYITSQGNPKALENAKNTIMYAVIGLVLAILASTIVGFIAGRF